MLFWDLRAGKFLESTMNSNRAVSLKASKGWMVSAILKYDQKIIFINNLINSKQTNPNIATFFFQQRDDNFVQNIEMIQQKYLPAIYTHCYDTSGTRLFAAGGPLQCGLRGNYVALFQQYQFGLLWNLNILLHCVEIIGIFKYLSKIMYVTNYTITLTRC